LTLPEVGAPTVVAPDLTVKATLPALAVPVPELTVAFRVTVASPYVADAGVTFVVVVETPVKVTVSAGFAPRTAEQGLVVVVQLDELRLTGELQFVKVAFAPAVAAKPTGVALSEKVMEEQVLFTVCVDTAVPVPPHDEDAFTVPEVGVIFTSPMPVPAKVRSRFLVDAVT